MTKLHVTFILCAGLAAPALGCGDDPPPPAAAAKATDAKKSRKTTDSEAQMASKSNAAEAMVPEEIQGLKPLYLEAVSRVERLHRRLLDLIKDEFDRMGWDDINPVQALLMFNIGDAEMTAGELRSRGYYLGSNVSYNLKKLVETGYIFQERSRSDRRSVRIRLTPKGEEVAEVIDELYDRHLKSIDKVGGLDDSTIEGLNKALGRLERFWVDQILYKL